MLPCIFNTPVWALTVKEFTLLKRDRATLAIIFLLPIIQILLFGYTTESNPKHLPMAVNSADYGRFTRALLSAMKNTDYFDATTVTQDEIKTRRMLDTGQVQFVLNIPPNFSRDLVRGNKPQLLLEADGTDPMAVNNAIAAVNRLIKQAFTDQLRGGLDHLNNKGGDIVNLTVHLLYNPTGNAQYNIIPGLIGIVLTGGMIVLTALSITIERSEGTLEALFAMPIKPIHIILGKILPNIIIGYIQALLVLATALLIFKIPCHGSLLLLLLVCLPFIIVNLSIGILFSMLAKSQLQALQLPLFFIFPSLMLSGFVFPFLSMPIWGQWLGELLPATHFIRITRSIMLKGGDLAYIWPELWPLLLLTIIIISTSVLYFKRTLD